MTGAPALDVDTATDQKAAARREPPSGQASGILIGYVRCSTEKQDLTAQRQILRQLGVAEDRIYLDHGLTGRNRSRPGLNNALAASREGDTPLVVPKLDRLARSVPDARAIEDSLAARGVRLSLGASVYDPNDPMGNASSTSSRPSRSSRSTCCGCVLAKGWRSPAPKADPKAKHPSSARRKRRVLLKLHAAGDHSIAELAELFSISRATVYRELARTPLDSATADVR